MLHHFATAPFLPRNRQIGIDHTAAPAPEEAQEVDVSVLKGRHFLLAEDHQKALAAGMTEHLTKPLDPDSVYRMLVKFCRKAG